MTLDDRITELLRTVVREEIREALREHTPAPAPPETDFLTVAEAAKLVRMKPSTLRDWCNRGVLDAGRRPYRIRRADLLACLAKREERSNVLNIDKASLAVLRPRRSGR